MNYNVINITKIIQIIDVYLKKINEPYYLLFSPNDISFLHRLRKYYDHEYKYRFVYYYYRNKITCIEIFL